MVHATAPWAMMDAILDLLGLVTLCQFSRNVWVSLRDVRGTDGSPVSDNVWFEPAFSYKGLRPPQSSHF